MMDGWKPHGSHLIFAKLLINSNKTSLLLVQYNLDLFAI